MQDSERIYRRYQDLQSYVGWTDDDAERVAQPVGAAGPSSSGLVEDFYAEIARHSEAHKVFTGGRA